jgi:hypothetical protein
VDNVPARVGRYEIPPAEKFLLKNETDGATCRAVERRNLFILLAALYADGNGILDFSGACETLPQLVAAQEREHENTLAAFDYLCDLRQLGFVRSHDFGCFTLDPMGPVHKRGGN